MTGDIEKEEDSYFELGLNPCSLEILSEPITLGQKGDEKAPHYWPTAISCYELQEDGTRQGKLELRFLTQKSSQGGGKKYLTFGDAIKVIPAMRATGLDGASPLSPGILDGKWFPKGSKPVSVFNRQGWMYAVAESSGEISIFLLEWDVERDVVGNEEKAWTMRHLTTSTTPSFPNRDYSGDTAPLCLSVNWDTVKNDEEDSVLPRRLVSSYSNGCLAIHELRYAAGEENGLLQLNEMTSWFGHNLFGTTPAEVWCTCFVGRNLVMSGGDDAKVKIWDCRLLQATTESTITIATPVQTLSGHFDAGVTVMAPHPRIDHIVAVGSYDETVRLYDVRIDRRETIMKSNSIGGGIWRLSWHPRDDDRLLVAAMHGGCHATRLLDVGGGRILRGSDGSIRQAGTLHVEASFTKHKSMVYGADWLVSGTPGDSDFLEAVASCSFYDKAAFLWRTDI